MTRVYAVFALPKPVLCWNIFTVHFNINRWIICILNLSKKRLFCYIIVSLFFWNNSDSFFFINSQAQLNILHNLLDVFVLLSTKILWNVQSDVVFWRCIGIWWIILAQTLRSWASCDTQGGTWCCGTFLYFLSISVVH